MQFLIIFPLSINTKGDLFKGFLKGYAFHERQVRDYDCEYDKYASAEGASEK